MEINVPMGFGKIHMKFTYSLLHQVIPQVLVALAKKKKKLSLFLLPFAGLGKQDLQMIFQEFQTLTPRKQVPQLQNSNQET